jgi:DNA-binding transcriptional LysR family regulator
MEMRHLRYFVAVAQDLSFRRAAHRLHLSHPSLSQQISDLEHQLGMKLFKRNSRRVELTEPGRVFLAGARQTLKSIQKTVVQAKEVAKGERGRLVIGNIGLLTQNFLPTALADFRHRYPLVEVTVNHMNSHAQVEALLDGSIMLGIGYVDPGVEEEDRQQLATEPFLRCPYGMVYSKHRRFSKGRKPGLRDFRDDRLLAFAPEISPVHAHWTRELCQKIGGFDPKVIEAIANSREDMTSMVAAGRGVWLAPEIAVPANLEAVNYQRLDEIKPKYALFLVSKKDEELPATVQQFIRVLKGCTNAGVAALEDYSCSCSGSSSCSKESGQNAEFRAQTSPR